MKRLISVLLTMAMLAAFVPTLAFAEESGNELPVGYIDTSNAVMHQMMSAAGKSEISLLAASENAGKKVEIAFVIDTTGSMSGAISNVKSSVMDFAKYLEDQGVNLRMSVVEYRDIAEDGNDSTIVHTINHSPWHTSTAQLVETLSNMSVDGGGDIPETLLDGLGCLVNDSGEEETTMRWSSDAYKFAFVLTDADYKINNTWGYEDMSQIISALNANAISTSVITSSSCYSVYKDLTEQTSGELADINSSDYVSSLKTLADNVLSNTVKAKSVDVTVKAISKDTNKEVPVEDATVSVFLEDAVRYYTTDSNGIATIPLNDLTEDQINKATVSAHKAWSGTVGKLNLRYPLFKRFGIDGTGDAERYIYELHSEGIDENGNWYGQNLSDIVKGKNIKMIIDEPRLLINMSVCYFEPSSSSASEKSEHKGLVKTFMSNLSKELAQSTDGHVMINKVLIGSTDERTDFYVNTNNSGSSPDYTTTTLASMADIRIEASKDEQSRIHSNARVQGFFSDNATWYIDDLLDGKFKNFSNLSDDEISALNGKYTFPRIQESWNAAESYYKLDDELFVTTTHESGHYILSFLDEYMDGNGDDWTSGWFSENKRPTNAPSNFGLMDYQYDEVELSTQYDYRYLDSIGTKDYDTMQSYTYNRSCEDLLSLFLENGYIEYSQAYIDEYNSENNTEYTVENARKNLLDVIGFKANYSETVASQKRRATYSYAEINNSKYIDFDGSRIDSEVDLASLSDDIPIYREATSTNDKLAEISIDNNGNITVKPQYDNNYYLYCYDSSSRSDYSVELQYIEADNEYVGNVNLSAGTTYEFYVVTESPDMYLMNTYQLEISTGSKGYLYESLDGALMIYLISAMPTDYVFTEDTIPKTNGDYTSANNSIKITASADSKGELYSVASINSNIDYTTISWFKYDGTNWTKLDTDLSTEENMNIGARCDYVGEGTYVLMAKTASDKELNSVTDIEYTNPTDRDGIVNLTFNDSNANTAYYNIYYSDSKFTSTSDDNVAMQKRYAGADSYSVDFEERNKDGYVAVMAVDENGAKSPLSEVVEVNTGEADRDGDGIPDWYCDKYLLWPPSGEEKDIANSDDDKDGLTNLEEYKGGSDPTDPNDPVRTSNVAVQSVELSKSTLSVKVGKTSTVTATIKPADASNKNIQWYTDDESVATVSAEGANCTITGVAEGTTKVTAVTVDGGYTASATVTVSKSSGSSGGGGSASLSKVKADIPEGTVAKGTKVTLSNSNSGAAIYYTTDGTTPTSKSTKYTTPIIIDEDITIKAIAIRSGYSNSSIATFTYKIGGKPSFKLKDDAAEIKYMSSYDDGTFKPDQSATRYEILTALNNLFDFENIADSKALSDVDSANKELVNKFVSTGIIDGYEDGAFRGNNGITRAEMVKILSIMFDVESNDSTTKDYPDISGHWAKKYIDSFSKSGYVEGYPDGTFKPDNQVTRAEFVKIVNNILGVEQSSETSYAAPSSTAGAAYNVAVSDIVGHWAQNDINAVIR